MRKTLGFSFLLLAALLFAVERIRSRDRQIRDLRGFCAMLEQLYGILEAESPPMPELLRTLTGCVDGAAADFIRTLHASLGALGERRFRDLWRAALTANPISRDSAAARELEELGAVLGRYELETQLAALSKCLQALRREEEKARQELPAFRRLTLGLSLAAAALAGILLM